MTRRLTDPSIQRLAEASLATGTKVVLLPSLLILALWLLKLAGTAASSH